MSEDRTKGEVNDSRAVGDGNGRDLLAKLKLFDLHDRKEVEIKTNCLTIDDDGEVSRFLYQSNWIYLRPRESFLIGNDDKLSYSLTLPASVRISVHNGNRRIIVDVDNWNLFGTLLTDKMLDRLRGRYPDGVRNIELVHELDKRFKENSSEIQRMLEMFKAVIEEESEEKTEELSAKDHEFKKQIEKLEERIAQKREELELKK